MAPFAGMPRLPRHLGTIAVEGKRLRDEHGREVILRGVNAGGRAKFAPFAPFEFDEADQGAGGFAARLRLYLDAVATTGSNLLRIPLSWEALEPEPGRYDEQYLDRCLALIDGAWARGIYSLVDFHQDIYASPFGGDGFPPWTLPGTPGPPRHDLPDGTWFMAYVDPTGPVVRAFDRLWQNSDGLLDAMERMWRHVARRAVGHPGIIGFEILNEPGWGSQDLFEFEATTWPRILTRMGQAVVKEHPGANLFAGGCGPDAMMASTQMRRPELTRFVYAPHYYDAFVLQGGPMMDAAKPAHDLLQIVGAGDRMQAPVLLGEFGASPRSPDAARWLAAVYDALDALRCHGTAWEASLSDEPWNGEDLSLFRADGSERPLLDAVVRPYPQAVAGELVCFEWNRPERRFRVEIDRATALQTEVFVPRRHFGSSPAISASGGAAHWDPDSEIVILTADRPQVTLEVLAR